MLIRCARTFDILHPDHAEAPQWRRCNLQITSVDNKSMNLGVTVRRMSNGSRIGELFESWGFRAGIDRIFEDIVRTVAPGTFLDDRRFALMYSSSRGASDNGERSPSLSFNLPDDICQILKNLSQHQIIAFTNAADIVAEREALRRKKSEFK